jgi:hypothetical protein
MASSKDFSKGEQGFYPSQVGYESNDSFEDGNQQEQEILDLNQLILKLAISTMCCCKQHQLQVEFP